MFLTLTRTDGHGKVVVNMANVVRIAEAADERGPRFSKITTIAPAKEGSVAINVREGLETIVDLIRKAGGVAP